MKQRILKQVTVRFEEPVLAALEATARQEHRTMSDQIRHFVETALDRPAEERAA